MSIGNKRRSIKGHTECKTLFETKVDIQNNMKTVLNRAITIENIDHIKEI